VRGSWYLGALPGIGILRPGFGQPPASKRPFLAPPGLARVLPRARTMTTFFRELQLAARSLAKSPTLALVAISTLAIGIGSNTAVFTLAHAVLLAPLP